MKRNYSPNGIIYENGIPIGFHDSAGSIGILDDDQLAEAQSELQRLADVRRELERRGEWNPTKN